MGNQAKFRDMQETIIDAVIDGISRVVGIMATENEKSLIFMLSAFCNRSEITVMMMPLIALRQNIIHRCRELGI